MNAHARILMFYSAVALSGCVGFIARTPDKCEGAGPPDKTQLVNLRGKPDEVKQAGQNNEEVWIYYVSKNQWCGIIPAWGIIVPLVLPVCDEYDSFTFVGEELKKAETFRMAKSGAMFILGPSAGDGWMEHRCGKS